MTFHGCVPVVTSLNPDTLELGPTAYEISLNDLTASSAQEACQLRLRVSGIEQLGALTLGAKMSHSITIPMKRRRVKQGPQRQPQYGDDNATATAAAAAVATKMTTTTTAAPTPAPVRSPTPTPASTTPTRSYSYFYYSYCHC